MNPKTIILLIFIFLRSTMQVPCPNTILLERGGMEYRVRIYEDYKEEVCFSLDSFHVTYVRGVEWQGIEIREDSQSHILIDANLDGVIYGAGDIVIFYCLEKEGKITIEALPEDRWGEAIELMEKYLPMAQEALEEAMGKPHKDVPDPDPGEEGILGEAALV